MTKDEYKALESKQLLIMFVGAVTLMVIFFAVKAVIHNYPLDSKPVEPFKYQAGYWKV